MEIKRAGISIDSLKDILSYRTRLKSMGITIDGLEKLLKISERFGGYTKVLNAIELYGEMKKIRSEIDRQLKDRDNIRGEIENLRSRIKELEELKALSNGRTLKEAEEAFLNSTRDRIEAEAKELSKDIIARWEASEKPRVVLEESLRLLNSVIEYLRGAGRELPRDLVDAGLIEKVRGIIDSEVQRRIDYKIYEES